MHIDWSTLALQLVNFAILVWLLQRFLYRPVLRQVDARRAAFEAERAEAAKLVESAKAERSALAAARAGMAAERAAALRVAAAQAEEAAASVRAQAEREAHVLMETTRKTLAEERERMLDELHRGALDLAAQMSRRMLAELPPELRDEMWLERIEKHLAAMNATERAGLLGELAAGAALRVVTASALPTERAAAWRARLCRALGSEGGLPVTFQSDPALIAGAELRLPHSCLGISMRRVIEVLQEENRSSGRPR